MLKPTTLFEATSRRGGRFAMILAVAAMGLAGPAWGQSVTEFAVPTAGSEPFGIAAGPDGNLWFTEGSGNKVGRITTAGVITEFAIPTAGSFPFGIAAGPDGALWFVEHFSNKILRPSKGNCLASRPARTATSGSLEQARSGGSPQPGSSPSSRFPPRRVPWAKSLPAQTTISGSRRALTTRSDVSRRLARLPSSRFPTNGSYPYGIAAGPDGNLWFTESNVNSVNSTGKIGRMTMSGVFSEFALSPANRHPFSVAAGPDGKLWFAEGAGKFGRITTAGVITEFMLPAAGGARSIAAGPDGALWFTEQVSDRIGRLSLAGSACMQLATNLCLNNARFQVEATWKSSDGASSGQAVSMTPDAGYFWFFSPNNPELVVKALDACSINGRSWLLVAGLTDVQVLLTVTDMQTGQVKTYTNPQHTLFQPILDASGFACP